MTLRWLMTLAERTRPDAPAYAECPAPGDARAVALVDDCAELFSVLRSWRGQFGSELTAWAAQVEADDLERLPRHLIDGWGPDALRLDTLPGGYVLVSDYREHGPRSSHMQLRAQCPALEGVQERNT